MHKEGDLVRRIKEIIAPKFDKVWCHKKPSASPWFRDRVKENFGGTIPILQPELDIILRTWDGNLNAIEVKYLNNFTKGYNIPYYRGIGQALALSRFGFDHVGLWLIVDENIDSNTIEQYGAQSWFFVRNELQLNLEYSFFQIINLKEGIDFWVMQYINQFKGKRVCRLSEPLFKFTFKYPNKIKNQDSSLILRGIIEEYLLTRFPEG